MYCDKIDKIQIESCLLPNLMYMLVIKQAAIEHIL